MTNILVMCTGEEERWDHPRFPKHLAPVPTEPLLERTLRMLGERKCLGRTRVVTHSQELIDVSLAAGCVAFGPSRSRWLLETLLYSRHFWLEGGIILLGDVYFTEKTLSRIIANRRQIAFYGTPVELFALTFHRSKAEAVLGWLNAAQEQAEWSQLWGADRKACGASLWHAYRAACGFPWNEERLEKKLLVQIHDGTTDFDTVERYEEWLQTHSAASLGEAVRPRD